MKLDVINASIVVLAEAHNPTILHPAFLTAQRIVPADWKLAEPPVCTPAISFARYDNGIVFTVEVGKFQVLDENPRSQSLVPDISVKYLETLPHVHYTAVGINICGCVACSNAQQWMLDRFVKPGPWNDDKTHPNAVGLNLVYPGPDAILRLSCDVGFLRKAKEEKQTPVLLINGNYHVNLSQTDALGEAKAAILRYQERLESFNKITQVVFGLEK